MSPQRKPRVKSQKRGAQPEKPRVEQQRSRDRKLDLLIYLALLLATFSVYAQVRHFDFVNLDDSQFTTENVHVQQGLTTEGLKWALTSRDAVNWFPLTWVSHMEDYQFFGADSGKHHIHNVLLHAIAAILLFLFLQRATSMRWRSALVAFIFALHPLSVESVAWVSERKDVLSACFWFLTLWTYIRYSERRSVGRYLAVALSLSLGLMAKPMLVTVPFILLLLDYWPLERFRQSWGKAVLEKLPLLCLSVADAAITYVVQKQSGAVKALPLATRLENATRSYAIYFLKLFWPSGLTVYYPFPREFPTIEILGAGLLLASITAGVIVLRRRAPYLLTGWGWFVVTLVPVVGLVQSGLQAYQAHYMYIPMVGLLIMVAWGVAEILEKLHYKMLAVPLAAAACLACAVRAWVQVGYWRNSETLFLHALEVTDYNFVANHNLGNYLMTTGRLSEAISYLETAVRIDPSDVDGHNDLGVAMARAGRVPEAIEQFQALIHMDPDAPQPHNDLGGALLQAGDFPGAIAEFQTALRLDPAFDDAHHNLGMALVNSGNFSDAIPELESYLRMEPNDANAHDELGIALGQTGRLPEAIAEFEAAVRLKPDYAGAQFNLGMVLSAIPGRLPDALSHMEEAERLRPDPQLEQAIAHLQAQRQ